jgi:flagellar hook protein FlgE
MGFQQGLSGLNAASKSLEVIGNNVSNSGTVGFKQSQAQFADVYAASLSGGGGSQIGIGTRLARVTQQFTQGNITSTSNPLDMAINGDGFFRMRSSSGDITYTRNGQFLMNKDGFIENANGALLTGYPLTGAGGVSTGAPVPISVSTADLKPVVTSNYDVVLNLDSRSPVLDTNNFDPNNPATYSKSVPVPIYDSLGNAHMLQTYYVNKGPTPGPGNSWDVYASVTLANGSTTTLNSPPAVTVPANTHLIADPIGTLDFSDSGVLLAGSNLNTPSFSPPGAAPMAIAVKHGSTTQFGSPMSVNSQKQNGYTSGSLTGFSVAGDGKIVGRYSNGKANVLGQIALVDFANPNGLQALGNNAYVETSTSGVPLISAPGSSGLGAVQASAVEDSNVDLTAELVNMITAQRVYQANAQTIKTEDQIMQTLVNLR